MSFLLQSGLKSAQQNDYTFLAVLTAVGYDHVLTLSKEIEYIWSKPWTWVSLLFILVRYFGIYSIIIPSFILGNFPPGPTNVKMYVFALYSLLTRGTIADISQSAVSTHTQSSFHLFYSRRFQGEVVSIITLCGFVLFLGAADFLMILRVWIMYNRSRIILGVLLTFLWMEIIFVILVNAILIIPRNQPVATVQLLNSSVCLASATVSRNWLLVSVVLQMIHGATMCTLAIIQFMKQSLQMYRATKQWGPNQYMNLLVKQGILYFFAFFLSQLVNALDYLEMFPAGRWQTSVLLLLEFVPWLIVPPRFILSIRELYARDVQSGCKSGIDTGFGLSTGRNVFGTGMVFADVELDEGVEEIPIENGTSQPE